MTVSEAIIKWLKTFDLEACSRMKSIDTDIQSARVDSYSLAKEPVRNVKAYLSGKKVCTDHYTIRARLASRENRERMENNGFGEALERWVEEQNKTGNYPALENAVVQQISVTTPFYMGQTATNDSVYQMTIAIKYEKEK